MISKTILHSRNLLFFCFFCLLVRIPLHGANCNSNGNGNWNSSGTWTCGNPPNEGDEITIGANSIVTINDNLIYTGEPMKVVVYGVWRFDGGGAKISMPCGSSVVMGFGGQVVADGSGNSQTVRICNTTYWSASDGTAEGPMAWPEHALPVELIVFNAQSNSLNVQLDWSTASEQNSAYFELQRSRDAREWTRVTSISAAGQSSSVNHYRASDIVPMAGSWYYRLHQMDLDGTAHVKGTLHVSIKDDRRELIFGPNPVADGWVDIHWPEGDIRYVEMVDIVGNKATPRIIGQHQGSLRLDLSGVSPGQHIIAAYDEAGERRSCRVLVR